ncbi:MAG: hypothetical protein AABZ57_02565, partial [Candidatus Margulisiibacteriota bacterium]
MSSTTMIRPNFSAMTDTFREETRSWLDWKEARCSWAQAALGSTGDQSDRKSELLSIENSRHRLFEKRIRPAITSAVQERMIEISGYPGKKITPNGWAEYLNRDWFYSIPLDERISSIIEMGGNVTKFGRQYAALDPDRPGRFYGDLPFDQPVGVNQRAFEDICYRYRPQRFLAAIEALRMITPEGINSPVVPLNLPFFDEFTRATGFPVFIWAALDYLSEKIPVRSFKFRQSVYQITSNHLEIIRKVFGAARMYSSGNAIQGALWALFRLHELGIIPKEFLLDMVYMSTLNETKERMIDVYKALGSLGQRIPVRNLLDDYGEIPGAILFDDETLPALLDDVNFVVDVVQRCAAKHKQLNIFPSNDDTTVYGGGTLLNHIMESLY